MVFSGLLVLAPVESCDGTAPMKFIRHRISKGWSCFPLVALPLLRAAASLAIASSAIRN